MLYGAPLPHVSERPDNRHAVELITSLLTHSDQPVTILGIGPLTNIAEAIERKPAILSKIERVVIMAGALQVRGHVVIPGFNDYIKNEVTDWNTYVDPLAAQIVFRSGVPITLAPLDATNKLPLNQEFARLFKEKARSPEATFLDSVFGHEMDFIKAGIYYFWDPLAASAIVDRDLIQFHNQKLDVVVKYEQDGLRENAHRFSTARKNGTPRQAFDLYVSGQIIESEGGRWVEVCTDVDDAAFYQRFIQVINREY